ncbi:hypothetical protein Tco_0852387 [Tanacetum coccineum]
MLVCQKISSDNGENIMKSINEGPFHMGTVSDVIACNELIGAAPTSSHSNRTNHISTNKPPTYNAINARNKATVQDGRVVVQDVRGQNRGGIINPGQAKPIKCYNCNGLGHILENDPRPKAIHYSETTSQDKKLLNASLGAMRASLPTFTMMSMIHPRTFGNVQCDLSWKLINVMHSTLDVDEAPKDRPCSWVNLSSEDPIYDEAGPSHDSNTPLRYKELVGVYEQRAKFELTDRERKIDEQMRIIISDRNRKETSLKSELHSAQLQLRSTLNHHKIVREEAIILKKDFKQKEDKFLEEFLDIKRLKEKVEDRLYKQDQSVQTVHMICKPKSFYDEKNKVAIGYKNPLCLTRAKQVQPALYNGHVLVMSNHARPVVHDSEDTRDMAEITRKRMMEKMQSPQCVENKVRIAPPDYSKENLLATFAPQRNLTPEQIFWSIDNNDRKKAETSVPKPLSALTVYPPNTPVKLVPRVLPTKSQVKINLYVLTQLFTEFDKTCKKRITPTGVTEGERGFEQTKRCYLTEVIPFFKTLKEHFAGVQTALFKEVKVMEEIFDQMSDEVDQNVVDKQCAEIVKKNLLIENENLIANCLSNQLLFDVEKSRCLDLEAEMSKVHNESKHISKLEREYLNLQLKYQHLQESFDNNKSQASQKTPDFNSFFKIKNLEHQIQEKDNVIRVFKKKTT